MSQKLPALVENLVVFAPAFHDTGTDFPGGHAHSVTEFSSARATIDAPPRDVAHTYRRLVGGAVSLFGHTIATRSPSAETCRPTHFFSSTTAKGAAFFLLNFGMGVFPAMG